MIIISNKPGQLGNLLFIYANILAYGFEHKIKVLNPAFYEYQSYFEITNRKPILISQIIYKLSFLASRILDKCNINLQPFIYVKALKWDEVLNLDIQHKELNCNLCFLQGWLYRGNNLMIKHKEFIEKQFTPTYNLVSKIDDFFSTNFDLSNELIIAVHIRRGDYKYFEGGKYYYSIDDYGEIINKVSILFENIKIHFLICSNEKIDLVDLNRNNYKMTLGLNHELMDMYCMVRCHYIIGPPSTYTMWASYYGNTPLCMIRDVNKEIRLSDFEIQ